MPSPDNSLDSNPIFPPSKRHAHNLVDCVIAEPRPSGALRYRCPATGSFVLVTDEVTLDWLSRPRARLRCADCGELHSLACAAVESTWR
jgi:hypothetical protein